MPLGPGAKADPTDEPDAPQEEVFVEGPTQREPLSEGEQALEDEA
jgi:hypothetical protein